MMPPPVANPLKRHHMTSSSGNGGPPCNTSRTDSAGVMNFVGRSHDDIAAYRRQWEDGDDRFGAVQGYRGAVTRLPAPPLPNATLRPRRNPRV